MLSDKKLGFIGAGNMATALIRGMLEAQLVAPGQIIVSDIDHNKVENLVSGHGVGEALSNQELVQECNLIILAVKPQNMPQALAEISSGAREDQLFISIAAGVPISRIENGLGANVRVVRVMPNTPALIGAGAAAIAPGPLATERDVALTRAIFEAVGIAAVVEEKEIDAVTAVSGSGPAYVFYFMEALADAAVAVGLEAELARTLVKATVLGAAEMVNELNEAPSALREAVTSPGGTTQAALAVLREANFADLIRRAVEAAKARSIELGKL